MDADGRRVIRQPGSIGVDGRRICIGFACFWTIGVDGGRVDVGVGRPNNVGIGDSPVCVGPAWTGNVGGCGNLTYTGGARTRNVSTCGDISVAAGRIAIEDRGTATRIGGVPTGSIGRGNDRRATHPAGGITIVDCRLVPCAGTTGCSALGVATGSRGGVARFSILVLARRRLARCCFRSPPLFCVRVDAVGRLPDLDHREVFLLKDLDAVSSKVHMPVSVGAIVAQHLPTPPV
mmetsp:Transcript_121885/g.344748  ORF Transcript_121885/g.344748 Transcript_121885/m.344748 type:complete len:234 (-) Transcript_121885:249-950(-)